MYGLDPRTCADKIVSTSCCPSLEEQLPRSDIQLAILYYGDFEKSFFLASRCGLRANAILPFPIIVSHPALHFRCMPIELQSYLNHLLQIGIVELFLLISRKLPSTSDSVPDLPSIQVVSC